jgi:3-oxoadipate enol-lactonase/4-carboxymuconolactone decarboxylase
MTPVVALHHVVDGPADAPVLVLAPSLGSTLEMWEAQLPALTRAFRVVRIDLRGHGGSPAPPGPYTLAELGWDVLGLLDHLGIRRASVAGVSLGGTISMWLAANAPERIDRIVPICTSARFGAPESWQERADLVRSSGTEAIADAVLARWLTPAGAGADPQRVARMRGWLEGTPNEGYAACCEAIRDADLLGELATIRAPTLVIAGLEDPATPPEHAVQIAAGVPGARMAVVPGAAHLANIERPEEVASLMLDHLVSDVERDRHAAGMTVRRAVLGDEHVDRSIERTTPLTAPFQDFITRYAWGDVWTRPGIDRRARSMLTLALLCALGHENELAMHVRAAIRNGLTPEEIGEVLLHTAVYAGVPAANSAYAVAQRTLAELGLDGTT